jgi:hypothetical protein
MTQPELDAHAHAASLAHAMRPVLADTMQALRGLELHIEVFSHPPDPTGWLDAAALAEPDGLPLSALQQESNVGSDAGCGWASGFATGYLPAQEPVLT